MSKSSNPGRISREEILNLREGEVVRYSEGYLIVAKVDLERGVVTGMLESNIYGVNCLPIEELRQTGLEIAKWPKQTK